MKQHCRRGADVSSQLPAAIRGDPTRCTLPIDGVSVTKEIGRDGVVGKGAHDLLSVHAGVGCSVTLKCRTRRRW